MQDQPTPTEIVQTVAEFMRSLAGRALTANYKTFHHSERPAVLDTLVSRPEFARALLDARLAACVNILPRVRSIYRWNGAIESADECLLLIKSSRAVFAALRSALEKAHSYEIPEVVALPIVDGAENYLNWLGANLGDEEGSGA